MYGISAGALSHAKGKRTYGNMVRFFAPKIQPFTPEALAKSDKSVTMAL